jgi:multidrug efflux system outer membrane protein
MRLAPHWVVIACAALAFAGCRTKPPPERGDIQAQAFTNHFSVSNAAWRAGAMPTGAIQDNWLSSFNDTQLDALVEEALTNNLDLAAAALQVERAAAQVDLARSALRPAIRVLGSGGIKGSGGDGEANSPLNIISAGVSWEPDLWGRLRYGRNAAQSAYESVQADFEFGRQSLAASVARSWFMATETLNQQRIADEMVGAAAELLKVAENRHRVGAGSEQDVALARANVRSFEDNARQTRLAHQQAVRAVELMLGRYPAAELEARPELAQLPGPVPVGMPLDMLERRPDLVGAERRVAAAFNRVGESKAAMLPRIGLNASVGLIDSEVLQLKDDFENPSLGAGGRVVAPIYLGGALRTQVKIRTIEQKAAIAEYGQMALRAIGDVESALATGANLAERESILADLVEQNARALELTDKSYRIGKSSLADVQQRQIDLNASRLVLLRVRSEALNQRVNLHLALGGSFEQPAPETTPAAPAESEQP